MRLVGQSLTEGNHVATARVTQPERQLATLISRIRAMCHGDVVDTRREVLSEVSEHVRMVRSQNLCETAQAVRKWLVHVSILSLASLYLTYVCQF